MAGSSNSYDWLEGVIPQYVTLEMNEWLTKKVTEKYVIKCNASLTKSFYPSKGLR